jgi:Tol biopolymer transport system component/tetratricopeptide (TPR) repeat protein
VATLNELHSNHRADHYFLPFELLAICEEMLKDGKTADADEFCSVLAKTLPEDLSIREGYARICAMTGFVPRCLAMFEELEREDPEFNLGDTLSALGYLFTLYPDKTDDALLVLQYTTEKFPEDPWAYYSLARLYRRLGDLEKAIMNCRKSLDLRPDVGDISQLLERLLAEQGQQKKQQSGFPTLKGPYLGQKPPGKTPKMFAPGIISKGYSEYEIAFSPDGKELFLGLGEASPFCTILWMKEMDDGWNPLQVAPFSGRYVDMKFSFSPDGQRLLFSSNRSPPMNPEPQKNLDIWFVPKTLNGWGEPLRFESHINTGSHDYYPSMAANGNLYFMSDREGGIGEDDIYYACFQEGKLATARNIGPTINTCLNEGDPFIAPDESYLLFCSRDRSDGFGNNDLFVSYRKNDNTWTAPINLGEKINTAAEEVCPMVSHDGKYLFFSSNRKLNDVYPVIPLTLEQIEKALANPGNGAHDIYWVDASIINNLKPEELKK